MPWHNPMIVAPSLHQLATQGIVLEQNYVQPKCAPSRAALLTGRWETFADYCSDQISIAKVHFISLFPRFLNDLESFLLSILSNLDDHSYVHLTEFSRFLAITTTVLWTLSIVCAGTRTTSAGSTRASPPPCPPGSASSTSCCHR